MKEKINVTFIADDGYVMPTCIAITSLLENRNINYCYDIYVVVPENISETAVDCLIKSGKDLKNAKVFVMKASMEDLQGLHEYNDGKFLSATETALLKFKLPELFPNLDKILYVDGDILIRDDLIKLYETELGEMYAAVVRDMPQVLYGEKQQIGKEISGREYFNSGVMLLNLRKMRENHTAKKMIEAKYASKDDSLMDQNVFNTTFKDNVIQLSFLYNVCYINLIESSDRYDIKTINELYKTHYKQPEEIMYDIKIMHFSSKLKPWLFYDVPMADEWIYYYKKSVFKSNPIQRTWHLKRDVDREGVKKQLQQFSSLPSNGKKIIPIVFATNKDYAPYVAVAIESIYENSSPEYFYDINILIDASMTNMLKAKFNNVEYQNMSVRMWDVRNCFKGINLYSVGHYSRQMYFRWLIPEIFPQYEKVLYLDCDIVVNRDIAELYNADIGDCYIGAINNFLRSNMEHYVKEKLGLSVKQYYNSGILLININEFLINQVKRKCLSILKLKDKLACPDQDVINLVCEGKIYKLDDRWNFQWHHQFGDICKGELVDDYLERYQFLVDNKIWIYHFTSQVKPWNNPNRPSAEIFWKYCKNTIFYEEILFTNIGKKVESERTEKVSQVNKEQIEKAEMLDLVSKLQYQIDEIRKSKTYKIGRAITFIPRLIRHVIKHEPM